MPIVYYLIIKPLSVLPFFLAYLVSDITYLLMYRIVGYRKMVVRENLRRSLPHLKEKERIVIEKKFYKHLCDLIMESLKMFSISKEKVIKHFELANPELLDHYAEQGRDTITVLGHYNNWEMACVACDMLIKHKLTVIYSTIHNKFLDNKIKASRSQYGALLLSKRKIERYFAKKDRNPASLALVADQSPTGSRKVFWADFLNRETAIYLGPELNAIRYDAPVFFADIEKLKRGHYRMTLSLITDKPREEKAGFITLEHTRRLEAAILNKPEFWLWTHKRWKKKKEPNWTEEKQQKGLEEVLEKLKARDNAA